MYHGKGFSRATERKGYNYSYRRHRSGIPIILFEGVQININETWETFKSILIMGYVIISDNYPISSHNRLPRYSP